MVSGSDMHGTPTMLRAIDTGESPESIANSYHAIWQDCLERMNFSYDLYTHTHTENHFKTVQRLFTGLLEKGYLHEATQTLPYSESEGIFLSDRMVEGECPHCNYGEARGDQCESCGRTLDPSDLLNIRSKRDKTTPIFKETKHYFLKLGNFQNQLSEWVEGKEDWKVSVRNQTLGSIREGLVSRAVTRDIEWGVPVPVEGYEKKRVYVWFEAVSGYLSATIEWAKSIGKPELWREFWEDSNSESYYFQGKDNVPFHTIIWPSILLGYGGLNLPTDVPANQYLNLGGKFSKSSGNAVWLRDYLSRHKPEPLRYYLSAIMPETSDSEFTWEGFATANNNELVATYGNFVHRTLTLVQQTCNGKVPSPASMDSKDEEALAAVGESLGKCAESIEARRFRAALKSVMDLAKLGNKYIDIKAPWKAKKDAHDSPQTTLWVCLNICSALRKGFYPFLPESSQKLHRLLGLEGLVTSDGWNASEPKPGHPLPKPEPLFEKIDKTVVEEENARLAASKSRNT